MQDDVEDERALTIAEDELATISGLTAVLIKNHQHVRISRVSKLARGASGTRRCELGLV